MIERYDYVVVREPGIRAWVGQVRTIKPPRPFTRKGVKVGQWLEIVRDDGITMTVPMELVTVIQDVEDESKDKGVTDLIKQLDRERVKQGVCRHCGGPVPCWSPYGDAGVGVRYPKEKR
jgi:hypothetical protein